eukprot:Skav224677  [mRNA]  locus=scaffold3088:1973:6274:- [translate_table: standard]
MGPRGRYHRLADDACCSRESLAGAGHNPQTERSAKPRVCIIGDGVFKFFRLQEGTFKGIPNQLNKMREASNQNYICHTWLNDDRLIVCSEAGDILLFDSGGEFKMAPWRTWLLPGTAGGDGSSALLALRASIPALCGILQPGLHSRWREGCGDILREAMTVSPAEETVAIATGTNQLLTLLG